MDRQFTAEAPDQLCRAADTTEFQVGERGRLWRMYLASVLALYSRVLVGWPVSAVNDRHPTIPALEVAVKRHPEAGVPPDSDQGCIYASED